MEEGAKLSRPTMARGIIERRTEGGRERTTESRQKAQRADDERTTKAAAAAAPLSPPPPPPPPAGATPHCGRAQRGEVARLGGNPSAHTKRQQREKKVLKTAHSRVTPDYLPTCKRRNKFVSLWSVFYNLSYLYKF